MKVVECSLEHHAAVSWGLWWQMARMGEADLLMSLHKSIERAYEVQI